MSLLRGLADDMPLMTWLQEHIWPGRGRHVSPEFGTTAPARLCRDAAWRHYLLQRHVFFPTAAAAAVRESGMRAVIGLPCWNFHRLRNRRRRLSPKDWLPAMKCSANLLLHFALAPHAPYTVSDRSFERVATLTGELDLPNPPACP